MSAPSENERSAVSLPDDFFLLDRTDSALRTRVCEALCGARLLLGNGEMLPMSDGRAAFGIVLDGEMGVYEPGGESETLINVIGRGGAFGALGLFGDPEGSPTQLRARGSCTVLLPEPERLRKLILSHPRLAENYIVFLTRRIRFLTDRVRVLGAGGAEEKAARLLLADRRANGTSARAVSMKSLAGMLGVGRATLYRILSEWEARGIVQKSDKKIEISDREALKSIANRTNII